METAGFDPAASSLRMTHSTDWANPQYLGNKFCWLIYDWLAELSKALVVGTSLSGGVGSNPTLVIFFLEFMLLFLERGDKKKINKKKDQGGFEPPTSRTQSENHTPNLELDHWPLLTQMKSEGFEPPTFGSGIWRATVAPQLQVTTQSCDLNLNP